jgi:hypothetical protein
MSSSSILPSSSSVLPSSAVQTFAGVNASALVPVLQGLLTGLGWQDPQGMIRLQSHQDAARAQAIHAAFATYQENPDAPNQAQLITVLQDEVRRLTSDQQAMQKRQQVYQAQAEKEASAINSSWTNRLKSSVKQFFGSDASEKAVKYVQLVAAHHTQLQQLNTALAQLGATAEAALPFSGASARRLLQHSGMSMPPATPTQPAPSEFRVNTYTTSAQWNGNVAALTNGDFAIAWQSNGQDGDGEGVYAQHYTAAGAPVGSEFQVNIETMGGQEHPVVVALPNGTFAVGWMSMGGGMSMGGMNASTPSNASLYAQRYAAQGALLGTPFPLNTPDLPPVQADEEHFNLNTLKTGDLIAAWQSGASDADVYVQQYSPEGAALRTPFRANTYLAGHQQHANVGALKDGGFVVTWSSDAQDGSGKGIYARRYNASGAAFGPEFQVNTYTLNDQHRPAIAVLTNGDFVISWQSEGQDGSGAGAYARHYNATGAPLGDAFEIATRPEGDQEHPMVASLTDGGFVFAWLNSGVWNASADMGMAMGGSVNDSTAGDLTSVPNAYMARRYSAQGVPSGEPFTVNTQALKAQGLTSASVSGLKNGDFVVTWTSYGQDGDQEGLYARVFSSSEPAASEASQEISGAVAGAVVGSIVAAGLLIGLSFWCTHRKSSAAPKNAAPGTEVTQISRGGSMPHGGQPETQRILAPTV